MKFKQAFKNFFKSVGVRVALITTIGIIFVAGMHIANSRSNLVKNNQDYINKIAKQKDTIHSLEQDCLTRDNKIQLLETQLTPFKTIALEKYTGSEQEALQKLAENLETLEQKTSALEKRLKPRSLSAKQISILTEKTNTVKNIKIHFLLIASDPEAEFFKNQIKDSLLKGGWTIEKDEIALAGAFQGITLYASQDPPNQAVQILYQSLKEFGFELSMIRDITLPDNTIGIKIGKKK